MPVLTSALLILALALAAVIGPLIDPWLWGPSLLALAAASCSSLVHLWRKEQAVRTDVAVTLLGTITAGWFAWRAWTSPVGVMADADLMLLSAAVCAFLNVRTVIGHRAAERVMGFGIALLLLASLVVIGLQLGDRTFSVWFDRTDQLQPLSGFFTHYNYGANFLVACSAITLAIACFSKEPPTIRVAMAVMGALAVVAILLSGSRGGFLAATFATGVLAVCLLIQGYQQKAKWFPAAAIALPLIGLLLVAGLIIGWQTIQETRTGSEQLDTLMDNKSRLMLLGAAANSTSLHPWLGGGSRSFLWEFVQIGADIGQQQRVGIPEFVHNEWMQAVTDYGLIGGGLLLALIAWILIRAIIHLLIPPTGDRVPRHTWTIAGLVGAMGILLQSCFSFVFHIMPGAILLGICLAMACATGTQSGRPGRGLQRVMFSLVIVAALACMIPLGWKATRTTAAIATSHYAKGSAAMPAERKIADLGKALDLWPHPVLYRWRAAHHQACAAHADEPQRQAHLLAAAEDYRLAISLHPYDGEALINLANVLSQLQHNDDATSCYRQLLDWQGKMERLYRGNYFFARHLYRIAVQQSSSPQAETALATCESAINHIDRAESLTNQHFIGPEGRSLQIACHELHGMLLEARGRDAEALDAYMRASEMHRGSGRRIHLRAAILLARQARTHWYAREPGKALALFMQARQQGKLARNETPEGMTAEQRDALMLMIEERIKLLRGAGIQPE